MHWDVRALIPEGAPFVMMVGDLVLHTKEWFFGATAIATVTFREGIAIPEPTEENEARLTRRLGPWANSLLYDTAAAAGHRAIGTAVCVDFEVPVKYRV